MNKISRTRMTIQKGFTLIELMIVIAILGILASIAIPAYQDYSIRAKVSEALVAAAPFTTAVATYYWTNSTLPVNRTQSGQTNVITTYIEGITITPAGMISVNINETTTGVASALPFEEMFVILAPQIKTGNIDWNCYSNNAADGSGDNINLKRYMPSHCR